MTKVYLVYMKGITESNAYIRNVWAVFTNKRKAQIYCRYKKESTSEEWLNRFRMKSVEWEYEIEMIWTDDFTYQLNQVLEEKFRSKNKGSR